MHGQWHERSDYERLKGKHCSLLGVDVAAGDVVTLTYPDCCSGPAFRERYNEVAALLAAATRPFRLVHDLRLANLFELPLDSIIEDATSIAKNGMVERVCFVVDLNPVMQQTFTLGLWMCPVQPARVFKDRQEACNWAAVRDPSDASHSSRRSVSRPSATQPLFSSHTK